MQNVNYIVKELQNTEKGSYKFQVDYSLLFDIINKETIEPKAESFSKQLKGDVASAISEGYQLLMELVDSWDGTGNFHTLFKTSYTNRLINLVKNLGRNKRKHNTSYDISLSGSVEREGEASPILEVINDESLHTSFDITVEENTLEELLEKFNEEKPEQGGLITLMLNFSDVDKLSEKTNAYAEYYGEQSYTPVIQKRVSRAKEAFRKFLLKNNYEGVLV